MTIRKGYKATDKDMRCRDYQFTLGEWHELPESGFHFCEHPSGVWEYYNTVDTRVFEVEVDCVEDQNPEPGASHKLVCRRVRLIREITPGGKENTGNRNTGDQNTGDRNTGDRNTGDRNTGYRNTGDQNTGDRNTGHRNTGDQNTGDRNTGDQNTGDQNTGYGNTGDQNTGDQNTGNRNTGYGNTGDQNTGDQNTGHRNTGDQNTGHRNTGDRNTGDQNTGYGNATNCSAGYFCVTEPPVIVFDAPADITRAELNSRRDVAELFTALTTDKPIPFEPYKSIPNITPEKLAALHAKHIAGRKVKEPA